MSYVQKCILEGEELLNAYVPEWQANYRAMLALPSKRRRQRRPAWQSDVRIPYIAEQIFTLLPRLVDPNFKVDLIPQQFGTPRLSLRAGERVLDRDLWLDKWTSKQAQLMLINSFVGYAWTKTTWLFEEKRRTVRARPEEMVPAPWGPGKPAVYDKTMVVNDRPVNSICHPYDIMHDPAGTTVESCKWIAHRYFCSVSEVRKKARRKMDDGSFAGVYDNTDQVRGGLKERMHELPRDIPQWILSRMHGSDMCEVIEVWSRENDRLYTVVNREVVLRDVRLPFWHCDLPFSCAMTQPDVLRLKGLDEVTLLRSLQQMLWLIENQKLDNTRLSMDMVLLIRDTVENHDHLLLAPGAKWRVPNPSSDVVPLQLPQPQLASTGDIESLRGRLQAITGLTYLTGGDASAMGVNQNTASGLMAIQEEGNRRVDFRLGLVSELCYTRVCDQFLQLRQQFQTDEVMITMGRDQEMIRVPPDLIAPKMWARSRALTDTLSKTLKQQNANTAITALTGALGTPIPSKDGLMKQVTLEPAIELLAESMEREAADFWVDAPPPMLDPTMAPQFAGAGTAPPNTGDPNAADQRGGAAEY